MTLRHMKIFVTVCESQTVTEAAKKLFIAQPSVSLAIAEIEKHYGVKLFDRMGKRLEITEAGKRFLQYGRHIVDLFEDMEKEMMNIDRLGVLRIGSSITIGNHLLPGYVTAFRKQYPQVKVKVVIDNTEAIAESVLGNRIDIALVEGEVHDSYIVRQKFFEDELVLICGSEHRFADLQTVELKALEAENWILREKGSAGRDTFDNILQVNGIRLTPAWVSSSSQAIIRAVTENLGISILPSLLVRDAIERGDIKRFHLKDISLKRDYYIIFHQNKFLGEAAKTFMNICSSGSVKTVD